MPTRNLTHRSQVCIFQQLNFCLIFILFEVWIVSDSHSLLSDFLRQLFFNQALSLPQIFNRLLFLFLSFALSDVFKENFIFEWLDILLVLQADVLYGFFADSLLIHLMNIINFICNLSFYHIFIILLIFDDGLLLEEVIFSFALYIYKMIILEHLT